MKIRFLSDLHVGSPTGVWPSGMSRVSKLSIRQNPVQKRLWRYLLQQSPADVLIFCGDLMDKAKFPDIDLLQVAAARVVDAICSLVDPSRIYFVRGTQYHEEWYVGLVGSIAYRSRVIVKEPNDPVFEVLDVKFEDVLLDVAHHPESSAMYKGTVASKILKDAAVAAQSGKIPKMPDLIVRSHRHFYANYEDNLGRCLLLPCFEVQSEYAVMRKRFTWIPDIGWVDVDVKGSVVRVEKFLFE